ncbi:MAG: hypothetical protein SFW67_23860 [Myxococcaceae bacterium]|nr:hypothetical protein [Myxococcaceae bacterium]
MLDATAPMTFRFLVNEDERIVALQGPAFVLPAAVLRRPLRSLLGCSLGELSATGAALRCWLPIGSSAIEVLALLEARSVTAWRWVRVAPCRSQEGAYGLHCVS